VVSSSWAFCPRFVWVLNQRLRLPDHELYGLTVTQYEDIVSNIAFPALLGDITIKLWLALKGANVQRLTTAAPARTEPHSSRGVSALTRF
jgi:hypothetical protein